MSQTMKARWTLGLILVGLTVGNFAFITDAQVREPQPGDYFWSEVSAGTVGALVGGLLTATSSFVIIGYVYDTPCTGLLFFGMTCRIDIVTIAGVAFLIGNVVGGSVGVILAGSHKRVQGNILLAVAGAIAGAAIALSVLATVEYFSNVTFSFASILILIIPPFLPLATGLGAALGFNIDAKVEPIILNPTGQDLILVGI